LTELLSKKVTYTKKNITKSSSKLSICIGIIGVILNRNIEYEKKEETCATRYIKKYLSDTDRNSMMLKISAI